MGCNRLYIYYISILYIEASGNYILINLGNNNLLSTRVPINEMLQLLPSKKFFRIHRAFNIATEKITKYDRIQVWIEEKSIPIGDTYAHSLHNSKTYISKLNINT